MLARMITVGNGQADMLARTITIGNKQMDRADILDALSETLILLLCSQKPETLSVLWTKNFVRWHMSPGVPMTVFTVLLCKTCYCRSLASLGKMGKRKASPVVDLFTHK
jgi:hypothetical protein